MYSVTAGTSSVITAAGGTVMQFRPNSFKDANGHIITGGTVNLQVTEMYKPGDMIANRASTMAQGKILQSGGQINIIASMSGQPVYANNYGVQFAQATASSAPMSLFYGNTNNTDSILTWTNGGDSLVYGTTANGTTLYNGGQMYIFDNCTHFGFINCDWFNSDTNKTSVSVIVPDTTFNPSNTQIYLILPDMNSVLSNDGGYGAGSGFDSTTKTMNLISEGQSNIVPIGMNYKFVVITKKNGSYYYYQTSGVITSNMKLTATMALKSTAEVKTLLSAL